ncbi:MAG: site-2 protease family protein [Firmicutes bacterium]|nr:site-2 protease family protein [Bacillota bacterium]
MYIVIGILFFGILITIHELGHFTAAKLGGVRVFEFAIGMGPKLLKKQGKETLYTWRLLPIGGFCNMGEDAASEDPRAFVNQRAWKRTIILAAGSIMNFLLGLLIILFLFSLPQAQQNGFPVPKITGLADGFPYEGEHGLQVGDIFYKIDGERIYTYNDVSLFLSRGGDSHTIVLLRDGQRVTLADFTMQKTIPGTDTDGKPVMLYGFTFEAREHGFGATLKFSWYQALSFVRMVRLGLSDLLTGRAGLNDMAGLPGILNLFNDTGNQAQQQDPNHSAGAGLQAVFYFGAFIAINLAVMNMLPIPALDGGRIVFLWITWVIEKITKRKLDPKYEGYIHGAVFVLLLGLIAYVTLHDVWRLIWG